MHHSVLIHPTCLQFRRLARKLLHVSLHLALLSTWLKLCYHPTSIYYSSFFSTMLWKTLKISCPFKKIISRQFFAIRVIQHLWLYLLLWFNSSFRFNHGMRTNYSQVMIAITTSVTTSLLSAYNSGATLNHYNVLSAAVLPLPWHI
jgi:hypothetical protein